MQKSVTLLNPLRKGSNKILLMLTAFFFVFMLISSLNRYYSFYSSYDQGLFDQLFWNSLHGNLFQGSLSSGQSSAVINDGQISKTSYYHLGQHFVLDFLRNRSGGGKKTSAMKSHVISTKTSLDLISPR